MKKLSFLNRRTFLKKSATKIIPFLVCTALPSVIVSCDGDDPLGDGTLCNECENSCKDTCTSSCSVSCIGSSQSSSCSGCSTGCSGNCSSSCQNASSNNSTEKKDELSDASGTIGGYEYVDMGLSVKWARYNVGASSINDYGILLAKGDYTVSGGMFFFSQLTLENPGNSICGTKYDVAKAAWGDLWRLPTKGQFQELIDNSDVEDVIYKSIAGKKFTSKKNGNSIFLPYAGSRNYTGQSSSPSKNNDIDERGEYWSGDIAYLGDYDNYDFSILMYQLFLRKSYANVGKESGSSYSLSSVRAVTKGSSTSNCNNNCTASCANSSTGSSCSNCSSNCSSNCKTACDYNCAATCVSHCYGSCNDTCGGGCKYVSAGSSCSGCAHTCSNRCYHSCSYACSSNCQSSCVNGSK